MARSMHVYEASGWDHGSMQHCEHQNVTVDIVEDHYVSGHSVTCNECGRWWRYYMDWRVAWEHFNEWERSEGHGSPPETIRVSCFPTPVST